MQSSSLNGSNEYNGGRILHIKVTDFMTYDSMELHPCPGLNLIVGPNGSGKSTTVCAICLGLGGKPVFAGRQMHIKDFIKHGKKKAIIEITLDDPDSENDLVIHRIIKADGSSQYTMNDMVVKEDKVHKEVSRFNIQTNNLCQFLPQERVSEFSKMNPVQLLESMQQAVGDPKLFKNHDDLKKLRVECCNLEEKIKSKENYINTEKNKNKQTAAEAQIFEDIQKMTQDLSLLKEQLSLKKYIQGIKTLREKQKEKSELEKKIKGYNSSLDPEREELKKIENSIELCNKDICELRKSYVSNKRKVHDIDAKINDLTNKIDTANDDLTAKIQQHSENKTRIQNMENLAQTWKNELVQMRESVKQREKKYEETLKKIEDLNNETSSLDVDLENIRCSIKNEEYKKQNIQNELKKLSDMEHKKLQLLKRKDLDTYNAVVWLKDNRDKFKKHIYNPILMELEVLNPNDIKYIENHIGFRDLIAFVCEDVNDSKLLVRLLRTEKRYAINVVVPPNDSLDSFKPKFSHDYIKRKFGLKAYLKDLLKAPEPITKFLCSNYYIHNTPIGESNTEISRLKEDGSFVRFYTPDSVHSVKRSKYGAKLTSLNTSALRHPTLIGNFHSNVEDQKKLEQQIEDVDIEIKKLKDKEIKLQIEMQSYNKQLEELRKEKKSFRELKSGICSLEVQIKHKEAAIQDMKNKLVDVDVLKRNNLNFVNEKRKEILSNFETEARVAETCISIQHKLIIKHFEEYCFSGRARELKTILEDKEQAFENYKIKLEEIKTEIKSLTQLSKSNLANASETIGVNINEGVLSELQEKFGKDFVQKSVSEIESEMEKLSIRIRCFGESDKQVYDDHQKRKKTIAESEKELKSLNAKLEVLKNEISRKKDLWLTPLKLLISNISNTFSKYFEKLECAGEINLKVSDHPDDFDKYGLSILVKFRTHGGLQELSHARHSGGECSVSTIIFILALQKLTDVPFRCVDEINQGMDSVNERRVFELVSMSSGTTSQYFLLTPKLLPELEYHDNVKMHIIHNAPLLEHIPWDISGLCNSVKLKKGWKRKR